MPKHQVINPANSEVLYEYNYTTWEEADIALNNLKNIGLKQQKSLSPIQRFETLLKLKELVLDNKEILAKQISLETGKIISESLVEVDRALVTLEYSAEEAKRINGEAQTLNHLNDFNMQFSLTVKKPLSIA